jgi:hypothetical protein
MPGEDEAPPRLKNTGSLGHWQMPEIDTIGLVERPIHETAYLFDESIHFSAVRRHFVTALQIGRRSEDERHEERIAALFGDEEELDSMRASRNLLDNDFVLLPEVRRPPARIRE